MNVEVLEDCEIIDDPIAQETAEVFFFFFIIKSEF